MPGYRVFDERFAFLFNSYYVAAGPRHARPQRGLITRPSVAEVAAYRAHVDAAVERADRDRGTDSAARGLPIVEIGLHHEQQHQELMLTDILHAFAQNPTASGLRRRLAAAAQRARGGDGGFGRRSRCRHPHPIGHEGAGFCFDNERRAHQVLLQPVRDRAHARHQRATWLEFMADGGYATPSPLALRRLGGVRGGRLERARLLAQDRRRLVLDDARGSAAGRSGAAGLPHQLLRGRCVRALVPASICRARPNGKSPPRAGVLDDAFGVVWQWTRSAYLALSGLSRAAEGALGEYNGKFMVNQMVLRGSSLATPAGHARMSYRNFFYPPARWQFSGLRLAEFER